jgi:hypothetical protein
MKPADRQKICPQCDGRVPFDAAECPYCANEFPQSEKTSTGQAPLFKNQSLQESLASLYTPPYNSAKSPQKSPVLQQKMSEFKKEVSSSPPLMNSSAAAVAAMPDEDRSESSKASFWAIFALIVGGHLLTLGLLQLFFSEEGALHLEWDSQLWYLYCLISLPLFYFGYKKTKELH